MSKQNVKSLDVNGKTVDEAIEKGLIQLNLAQEEVNIEVLKEGKKGVFGLGAEDALVRITVAPQQKPDKDPIKVEKPVEQQPVAEKTAPSVANTAVEINNNDDDDDDDDDDNHQLEEIAARHLRTLIGHMGIEATVEARVATDLAEADENPPLVLNIVGKDLGVLIGRRSETLRALQYVLRLIVSKELKSWQPIIVDVESYRVRRRQSLQRIAEKMAERAMSSNKRVILESMPANERRIIHLTLKDHPAVITKSIGYDENRKVTIIPK